MYNIWRQYGGEGRNRFPGICSLRRRVFQALAPDLPERPKHSSFPEKLKKKRKRLERRRRRRRSRNGISFSFLFPFFLSLCFCSKKSFFLFMMAHNLQLYRFTFQVSAVHEAVLHEDPFDGRLVKASLLKLFRTLLIAGKNLIVT